MGYCRQTSLPAVEPVSLQQVRSFLRLPDTYTANDDLIQQLIIAAREKGENITGRALAKRTFVQVLDSHPYYTDSIQSQQAYPPSYYSLPRYSTTLWNYSQMIKLGMSPVISVERMRYIKPDGSAVDLHQDVDFVLDRISEPSRIFPLPGKYWPADLPVCNAVQIEFTAGYDPNPTQLDCKSLVAGATNQQPESKIVSGIPYGLILAMLNEAAYNYNNRGTTGAEHLGGAAIHSPGMLDQAFMRHAIIDFAPTRG